MGKKSKVAIMARCVGRFCVISTLSTYTHTYRSSRRHTLSLGGVQPLSTTACTRVFVCRTLTNAQTLADARTHIHSQLAGQRVCARSEEQPVPHVHRDALLVQPMTMCLLFCRFNTMEDKRKKAK